MTDEAPKPDMPSPEDVPSVPPSSKPEASAEEPASSHAKPKGLDALDAAKLAIAALKSVGAAASAPQRSQQMDEPAPVGTRGTTGGAAHALPIELPAFDPASRTDLPSGIDLLWDVNLRVRIELGRTRMHLDEVLKLSPGAVVELEKLAGDPVDVYVNDRHVARGEILVMNDNFCVRISEILELIDEAGAAA